MRLASSLVLALPLLAGAEEMFQEYKAQFQNILGQIGSYIPNPNVHDEAAAAAAKTGEKKLAILTLDNWKDTLYEHVQEGSTVPDEWWVFVSGRNKTCLGRCGNADAAWDETAIKFADKPDTPHMGYLNCDDQPILCHIWGASPGRIWAFDMLPPPAPITISITRLNVTTVTADKIVELQASGDREVFTTLDSWFHPFDGPVATYGLALFVGYTLWALDAVFSVIPNWLFMIVVSFISRTMMSRRMTNHIRNAPAPAQ